MMPISSYTTTILFLYTFLVLICQSSCFPTPRTQSQRLGQTSCRSSPSSQSNNSHDTNIQPWVGIASIKRSKNKEPNSSNYLCSNPEVEIQTSKDHSKNDFSWLHVRRDDITAVEDDVNVNHFIATETKHDDEEGKGTAATKYKYDLSSPREWLEYQEMKDGIHGAYTVLRCDLFMNNKQNHDQRYKLWGKGFHLKRISNSFIQMAMQNHEEHKNDCKSILEQALIDSEQILDALIREVIDSCVGIESVSSLEQPNEGSVKIVMLTLLWTPSRCLNHSNELSISVRGHSYCSNLFSDPQLYDPKPITASVALPITTALTKVGPSRYDNLPAAKLSSWCRLRRPLEQLYKDRDIVGEVLLTRQRVIDGNENLNEWILLEGLTSNLFIVYKDGSIRTNSVERKKYGGVLGGYARHLVIEAAKQCDIPIVFGPINLDDGKHGLWAEAFVSSSIRLMAPIGRILIPDCIDGQPHLQELWSETELDKLPWTKHYIHPQKGRNKNSFRELQGRGCNFRCPSNSSRKPNRRCYDTFDDCQCNQGFSRTRNQCVNQSSQGRECNFRCPSNSSRKPNRRCYDTFDDCQCNRGFSRTRNQCVNQSSSPRCSRDKKVKVYKFCINGDADGFEFGDNPFKPGEEGEHKIRLDGRTHYPLSGSRCRQDPKGFCKWKEGLCHNMNDAQFQNIKAFKSITVGVEEFDKDSSNERVSAFMSARDWYIETCDVYEVVLSRDFKSERDKSFCWNLGASGSVRTPDGRGEIKISGGIESCSRWIEPAESYIWFLEVVPDD